MAKSKTKTRSSRIKKYQTGGQKPVRITRAPQSYKDEVLSMGRDTTDITQSPFDIPTHRNLINTGYGTNADWNNHPLYKQMPFDLYGEYLRDPLSGPAFGGDVPMDSLNRYVNLPQDRPGVRNDFRDMVKGYQDTYEPEFRYGGMLQVPTAPPAQDKGANLMGHLGSAGSMAATGMSIGGPIGAGVGAVVGGLSSIFGKRKQNRAEQEAYNKQLVGYQDQLLGMNPMGQQNIPTFKKGGLKKYQMGGMQDELLTGTPNAEVENNEVIQSPMGEMATMSGPTHEQGGIPVSMDPGDRVYSDELKDDDGKTFAEKADKARKSTDKYDKILQDPRATKLAKFTANKMLQKLNGELDSLFNKQESMKPKPVAEGPIDAELPQFNLGGYKFSNMWNSLSNRPNLGISGDSPIMQGQSLGDFSSPVFAGAGFGSMTQPTSPAATTNPSEGYTWGQGISDAATYAPAAYNLLKGAFGGPPDIQFNPNQYTGFREVTPRRTDLDPLRRGIEANEASARRTIRNMGAAPAGASYARMASLGADSKRAMADISMREQEAYNQADLQAQMANQQAAMNANQMGMQGALSYEDMRQRANAVPGAHLTAGLTQISDIAQSRELMGNQMFRDTQRDHALEGYSPMYGYTDDGMEFGQAGSRIAQRRRRLGFLNNPINRNRR